MWEDPQEISQTCVNINISKKFRHIVADENEGMTLLLFMDDYG